jgi:hypothetical protein
MATTITPAFIADLVTRDHNDIDVACLITAISACDNDTLDTYLRTMTTGDAWDLYDIASDLTVVISDNISAYDEDFVSAVNWVALSAKARGQGHQ